MISAFAGFYHIGMQRSPSISPSSKRRKSSDRTIELGGFATALVSALIVLLGFVLSQVSIYYFFLQPECVLIEIPASTREIQFIESLKQQSIVKSELVLGARTTSIAANETTTKAVVANNQTAEFPTTAKFPPKCTPHQLLSEHFDNKKKFTGVLVGCNEGYQAVELLRRLSSSKKYDVQEWIEEFGKNEDKIDPSW